VIAAAALGAILGDNVGYWLGREFGYPLLLRYGRHVGLTETRIKLGQYLFLRHGGKVVFFGRFIAVLRVLAAFLAGVNRMEWRSFLIANAAGGVLWSLVYGVGAYLFGSALFHAARPVTITLVIAGSSSCLSRCATCAPMKWSWSGRRSWRCRDPCARSTGAAAGAVDTTCRTGESLFGYLNPLVSMRSNCDANFGLAAPGSDAPGCGYHHHRQ